jgi:REP element-mobilizing transposase RayT
MKTEYRSRLPHIVPVGAIEFVTFNLWDAIPTHVVLALKEEFQEEIREIEDRFKNSDGPIDFNEEVRRQKIIEARWNYLMKFNGFIDQNHEGCHFLKEHDIALLVENSMKELDGQYYDLLSYCIMSNHVHALFDLSIQLPENYNGIDVPEDYYPLHKIMKKIKGATARYANIKLNRSGSFWMKDSFDHYIRNDNEMANIVNYIMQNPVKAGLCQNPEDWRFSYCKC